MRHTEYSLAGQQANAMIAYQKANAWQELFTLALAEKRTAADIKVLAVDVAGMSLYYGLVTT